MKGRCSKCNGEIEPHRQNKQRYCLSCHRADMRKNRPKYGELTEQQKMKANARSYLNAYLKRGKIKKEACSVCGDQNAQAHHEDYRKPLEIIWYCRPCHLDYHRVKENVTRETSL